MRNKSYGVREAYKNYQGVRDSDKVVSEKDYYAIVRETTEELIQELLDNLYIRLPYRLGTLNIRKIVFTPRYENGKLKGLPYIDWRSTRRGGYKEIIRHNVKDLILVKYSKKSLNIKGGFRIAFKVATTLKQKVREAVESGRIKDAYTVAQYN